MTKPLPLPSPSVVSEKLSPMEPRALTVRVRVRVRVRDRVRVRVKIRVRVSKQDEMFVDENRNLLGQGLG